MKTLEGLTIYKAESEIREYLNTLWVDKPREPLLNSNKPTKEDIDSYTTKLELYSTDLAGFKTKNEFYKSENSRLYSLLEDLIKEESGLNEIPEQYRAKVYSYAYQQGHSSGYSEVYNYLLDLVGIFY